MTGLKPWLFLMLIAGLVLPPASTAKDRLSFSGGPEGGTFQYFSNGISIRLTKQIADVEVSNTASAGSLENLRRVNSGEADFGIVYSGDTFLGRQGRLTRDERKYENVYAVAYLYGAPAHLVTLKGSGIKTVADLEGKRVAVGGAGSGAAGAAQRYFTALGLWDKMDVEFLGYSKAAAALGDKSIEAFWVLAGYPNSSVIQAAARNDIVMIDLVEAGQKAGFFEQYAFYNQLTIPAGTYTGIDADISSFQDSALWVAGKHIHPAIVSAALADIFSEAGLAYMIKVKSTARAMSIEGALNGIVTPVHEGAKSFWNKHGLEANAAQKAR